MTGLRKIGGEKIIADRLAAGRPGARRVRRHADPVRPRRRVRRGDHRLRPMARCGDPAGRPGDPAHGLERRRRRRRAAALFNGLDATTRFYFVHSYAAQQWEGDPDAMLTWATHHVPFLAAVEDGPLAATQFHPEKSGDAGAALLSNWVEALGRLCRRDVDTSSRRRRGRGPRRAPGAGPGGQRNRVRLRAGRRAELAARRRRVDPPRRPGRRVRPRLATANCWPRWSASSTSPSNCPAASATTSR